MRDEEEEEKEEEEYSPDMMLSKNKMMSQEKQRFKHNYNDQMMNQKQINSFKPQMEEITFQRPVSSPTKISNKFDNKNASSSPLKINGSNIIANDHHSSFTSNINILNKNKNININIIDNNSKKLGDLPPIKGALNSRPSNHRFIESQGS